MRTRHVLADDRGNIYAVTFDGDLLWYRDAGRNGSASWEPRSGGRIGNGWLSMRHVFAGGDGIIYAITEDGDLLWYQDGNHDGRTGWTTGSGSRIGYGWQDIRLAFSGGAGVIYAVKDNGDLYFYRDAYRNGTIGWAAGSGSRIGNGWQAVRLATADTDGSIYAVNDNGDLLWYKDVSRDGSTSWSAGSGNQIGGGWNGIRHAVSGGNGIIYAVNDNGDLLWYQDGNRNGSSAWSAGSGNRIGVGWNDVRWHPGLPALGHGSVIVNGRPAIGSRRLVVVLAEYVNTPANEFPPFPSSGAHSPDYYYRLAFGAPVPPFSTRDPVNPASLSGYVAENSNGRFRFEPIGQGVIGPFAMGVWSDAPTAVQRVNNAIRMVAQSNPFLLTENDLNHDGTVAFDELVVVLVENFDKTSPYQPWNQPCDPIQIEEEWLIGRQTTTVQVKAVMVGARTPFYQIAHETFHVLGLDAFSDLRGYNNSNSLLTLMGGYSFNSDDQRTVHQDAYHKHVLGWIDPRVYSLATPGEATIPITNPTRPDAPVLLWDPERGTGNYFLLEYRTPKPPQGLAYDENVAGSSGATVQEGLAIWRVPGIQVPQNHRTEHLGAPTLLPAGSTLWQPGQITPELTWTPEPPQTVGSPTGTQIEVRSIDRQRGTIQVAWWSKRFPAYIYAVRPNGELLWYAHDGHLIGGGLQSWRAPRVVGDGWQDFTRVFAARNGIMYAINREGQLLWYRHAGFHEGGGLETWQPQDAGYRVVGSGWQDVQHVFWGGDGVIYAIDAGGRLLWYKHNGYATGGGQETWEPQGTGYSVVGGGWENLAHVFSAGNGIIYAITRDGEMRWYHHRGWLHGGGLETWDSGYRVVGGGWQGVRQIFCAGGGIIYMVATDGTLRWYKHTGFETGGGLETWEPQDAGYRPVGIGWGEFLHVFAMNS